MDNFRLFASENDSSGVLSLDQLEAIRQQDLGKSKAGALSSMPARHRSVVRRVDALRGEFTEQPLMSRTPPQVNHTAMTSAMKTGTPIPTTCQ